VDAYLLDWITRQPLSGHVKKITARDVKQLSCSPQAKSVIQRCIGPRRKRFQEAARMLDALRKQEELAKPVGLRSLAGQRVVFTGALQIPRSKAKKLLRRAGGIVQSRVAHNTTVLVIGKSSLHFKAETKGQKHVPRALREQCSKNPYRQPLHSAEVGASRICF
jgi:NAD-dependent DNA ligase